MKRIFSFLFAIITLVGTTSVFTSCQEDAPEINYTLNVTVNNDFTEVVNAINNGTMKQEAAIAALTAAIEKVTGEQADKLQGLIEAINSLATTVESKLAIIEAAMKAQTLALETKLDLLTAAVKAQTLKQEEMGEKLATAIDNLSDDVAANLDAIQTIIKDTNTAIADKLALIEGAMKAQTLTLENKLALIEAAIKALPDYTEKLGAIEAAIKALPDYSTKLAAIETAIKNIPDYSEKLAAIEDAIKNAPDYTAALEEIKSAIAALPDYTEQLGAIITAIKALPDYSAKLEALKVAIEAMPDYSSKLDAINLAIAALPNYSEQLGAIAAAIEVLPNYTEQMGALEAALTTIAERLGTGEETIADKLQALSDEIANITAEVAAGNKSQEDALAQIIALLESGALAGGGSGSGEGEVDESYYVTFKSNQGFEIVVPQSEKGIYKREGATVTGTTDIDGYYDAKSDFMKNFKGTIISLQPNAAGVVTLKGKITQLISENGPTEIDATQNKMLEALELYEVKTLLKLTVANDGVLTYIDLMRCVGLEGANATAFMNSLPARTAADNARLIVKDRSATFNPSFSVDDIAIAQGKNWKVIDSLGEEQIGKGETDETYYITFKSYNSEIKIAIPQSEKGIYKIEGATVTNTHDFDGMGTVEGSFLKTYKHTELTLKPTTVGGEVKISGKITGFFATEEGLTEVDASHNKALELLYIPRNWNLKKLEIAEGGDLKYLNLNANQDSALKDCAENIVSSLQNRTGALYMENIFTDEQRVALAAKGWTREHF